MGETFNKCYEQMKLFDNVKPLCIVNCLNFGDPRVSLYDFKETINDSAEKCKQYKIPVKAVMSVYTILPTKNLLDLHPYF